METEDFLWVGTQGEIEERLIPRAGLKLETILGGAVIGVPWSARITNVAKLSWSVGRANRIVGSFGPNVLLMTGGYVSVPVALAAWVRRVPAVIYLPDIEPGSAIRYLSRFARYVACTTPASEAFFPEGKVVVTGYPVRPELRQQAKMDRTQALALFSLDQSRPTLLVFGGSRGARSINRALAAILEQLLATIQVIHISGELDWPEVKERAAELPEYLRAFYRPYPYLHDEMGAAFRSADLAVARAGASMLGEGPTFALPAILVPYPYAWRYQKVNADYLEERGAAIRLDDDRLAEDLLPTILSLLADKERLAAMSAAARTLNVPDASERLARLLFDLGRGAET